MLPLLTPIKIRNLNLLPPTRTEDYIIIVGEDEKDYYFITMNYAVKKDDMIEFKDDKQSFYANIMLDYQIAKHNLHDAIDVDFLRLTAPFGTDLQMEIMNTLHRSLESNLKDHTIVHLRPISEPTGINFNSL